MSEEARITFYKIRDCGYYKRSTSTPQYSNLANTLSELHKWVKDDSKPLGETNTYGSEDGGEFLRTFCFDMEKADNTGDFLLTTWNEIPSTDGKIASINPENPVGQTDVSQTKIPKNNIPGYATYFWFIPERSVLVTILFRNILNGHQNLVKYIKGFLENCPTHVVYGKPDDDGFLPIIGYRRNATDPIDEGIYPRYHSSLWRKSAKINYVKENYFDIKKIVRKDLISLQSPDDSDFYEKMLSRFKLDEPPDLRSDVKLRFEIDCCLNSGELDEIISRWEEDHNVENDDIGFVLSGKQKIYWLSHSLVRDTIQLDIAREGEDGTVVNAESLLFEIIKQRNNLLGMLEE